MAKRKNSSVTAGAESPAVVKRGKTDTEAALPDDVVTPPNRKRKSTKTTPTAKAKESPSTAPTTPEASPEQPQDKLPKRGSKRNSLKKQATVIIPEPAEAEPEEGDGSKAGGKKQSSKKTASVSKKRSGSVTKKPSLKKAKSIAPPRSLTPRQTIPADRPVLRIVSWNVNGLRPVVEKFPEDIRAVAEENEADVLFIQETKLQTKHKDEFQASVSKLLPGYELHWSFSTDKLGYSGTAVCVRKDAGPMPKVTFGIGAPDADKEGRAITLEYDNLFVVGLYVPNSGLDLARLPYRVDTYDKQLREYCNKLQEKKPVVITGDLNVAHRDDDIYNFDAPHIKKQPGCTVQERESFSKLLDACGLVDSFRHFHPEAKGVYTYWSIRGGNRAENKGLRLDYFLCSKALLEGDTPRIVDSFICDDQTQKSSDHCPVVLIVGKE